uniref:Uncharacterized protein n=1 Tax=candidate division WOR-3 bacterium TaxID=2052148 RepID=A0A7C4XKM2_UNCW3
MNVLLMVFLNASVFSIGELGQEQAIFRMPFFNNLNTARIEFTLRPEFNILNEDSQYRGIFWTNPFYLNMSIPVYRGLIFSFGNQERFNQSFDIYSKKDLLDMYVQGRGGIEEIYLKLNQGIKFAEIFFCGSYLYGSSREVWNYIIGDYSIADTFLYKFQGRIFSGGLRILYLSLFYEGQGSVTMIKNDTTDYRLPEVLGLGLQKSFADWNFVLILEHSAYHNDATINRIKTKIERGNYSLTYAYNPWYLGGIKEHGVGLEINLPFKNLGKISFDLNGAMRRKKSLREIVIIPQLRLTLEELFARRKK